MLISRETDPLDKCLSTHLEPVRAVAVLALGDLADVSAEHVAKGRQLAIQL